MDGDQEQLDSSLQLRSPTNSDDTLYRAQLKEEQPRTFPMALTLLQQTAKFPIARTSGSMHAGRRHHANYVRRKRAASSRRPSCGSTGMQMTAIEPPRSNQHMWAGQPWRALFGQNPTIRTKSHLHYSSRSPVLVTLHPGRSHHVTSHMPRANFDSSGIWVPPGPRRLAAAADHTDPIQITPPSLSPPESPLQRLCSDRGRRGDQAALGSKRCVDDLNSSVRHGPQRRDAL